MLKRSFCFAVIVVGLAGCSQAPPATTVSSDIGQGGSVAEIDQAASAGNSSVVTSDITQDAAAELANDPPAVSLQAVLDQDGEALPDSLLTVEELDSLKPSFQTQIQAWADTPAPTGQQEAKDFSTDWALVDADVAPFVGQWQGDDQTVSVYPSNIRGQACVLRVYPEPASSQAKADGVELEPESKLAFSKGVILEQRLVTYGGSTLIPQAGDYLGLAANTKKGAVIKAYRLAAPIERDRPNLSAWKNSETVLQSLEDAGCVSDLSL